MVKSREKLYVEDLSIYLVQQRFVSLVSWLRGYCNSSRENSPPF